MQNRRICILVIENHGHESEEIQCLLAEVNFLQTHIKSAQTLSQGLLILEQGGVDIILLDISQSEEQGFDSIRMIHHQAPQIPILILGDDLTEKNASEAIEAGAEDYLVKPQLNRCLLQKAICYTLEKKRLRNEMEQQNQALKVSENQLQTIITKNADGIIIVNQQGTILFVNPAAELLFGYPARILKEMTFGVPIVTRDSTEIEIVRPSGEFAIVEMHVVSITWQGETAYLASLRDMTARKRVEVKLEQLNQDLERRVEQRTTELVKANEQLRAEIAQRLKVECQLRHTAYHDSLTRLPNRRAFMKGLNQAISRAKIDQNYHFAVLFLDLDRFKLVNDSLGHLAGDQLLVGVARRLKRCLNQSQVSLIARFGGDEFIILLDELKQFTDATQIAETIVKELKHPFQIHNNQVYTTTSIGIALSSVIITEPEELIRNADIALYQAKLKGKSCYEIFDGMMYAQVVEQLQLEMDLRGGIEQEEFVVYYQPIVNLATLQISGFEALVRWYHPKRGWIFPNHFIPIAEDTGLIVNLDWWVLKQACHQMKKWQTLFPNHPQLFISVNLSSQQFLQMNFLEKIHDILAETQVEHQHLKLEITERTLINNTEATREILQQIRESGMRISIDDFGTGYSSLSYLYQYPIDTLKLDRSFVVKGSSGEQSKIVEAMIQLAHNLGMDVIAEGVETGEQLRYLGKQGCEYGQGYLFSPPVDAAAATTLLESNEIFL